jgi:hypothetical protein
MPGINYISAYKGSEVDASVAATADHETRIVNLEGGGGAADPQVTINQVDIAALDTRVGTNETKIVALDTVVGDLPTNYAAIAGSQSQVFHVANPTATTEAMNFQFGIATFAKLQGDSLLTFQCANPLNPQDAMTLAYGDGRYYLMNDTYSKAEADAIFVTQTELTTNYKTTGDIQIMIDNAIAAHVAALHPTP